MPHTPTHPRHRHHQPATHTQPRRIVLHALPLLAALLGLMLISCGPSRNTDEQARIHLPVPHQRGLAENPRRILLGMRSISEDWTCFRSTPDAGDEWLIDRAHDKAAVKRVRHDEAGKPTTETDSYLSGHRYKDEEGSEGDEELRVTCNWTTGTLSIAYLGSDPDVKKSIAKLPAFAPEHRLQYMDLVTKIVKKWTP
jgi:hypothetical protein